jgi:hypothetical protein
MKITFKASGGFIHLPGFVKPVVIDTAEISPQLASELESCVRESHFFKQPARAEVPGGAADYRTYTITVQDGRRARTIEFTDLAADQNLQRLASRLQDIARSSLRRTEENT